MKGLGTGKADLFRDLAGLRYLGKFGVHKHQEKMKNGRGEVVHRLDCCNITSGQKDKPGDRAHSTEEPKELRSQRQLEEKAKLEKAGETAAVLDLKGNKWVYPPSALTSRENAFCSDYKFPLCSRSSPKH